MRNVDFDRALVEALCRADQHVGVVLAEKFALRLRAKFLFHSGNTLDEDELSDAVSTVILKALTHRHQFSPAKGTLSSWLYGIARKHWLDLVKRRRAPLRSGSDEDIEEIPDRSTPYAELVAKELRAQIDAAMESLPQEQRLVVSARIFDQMSNRVAATALGMSESMASRHYHRGLVQFQKNLIDRGVDPPPSFFRQVREERKRISRAMPPEHRSDAFDADSQADAEPGPGG